MDQNMPDPIDQVFGDFSNRFVFIHPFNQLIEPESQGRTPSHSYPGSLNKHAFSAALT